MSEKIFTGQKVEIPYRIFSYIVNKPEINKNTMRKMSFPLQCDLFDKTFGKNTR